MAVKVRVLGAVDFAHAASAELADYVVVKIE
jgi:hypothetical protein